MPIGVDGWAGICRTGGAGLSGDLVKLVRGTGTEISLRRRIKKPTRARSASNGAGERCCEWESQAPFTSGEEWTTFQQVRRKTTAARTTFEAARVMPINGAGVDRMGGRFVSGCWIEGWRIPRRFNVAAYSHLIAHAARQIVRLAATGDATLSGRIRPLYGGACEDSGNRRSRVHSVRILPISLPPTGMRLWSSMISHRRIGAT